MALFPVATPAVLAWTCGALAFLLALAGGAAAAIGTAEGRVAAAVQGRVTIAIVSADPARLRAAEREARRRVTHLPGIGGIRPAMAQGDATPVAALLDATVRDDDALARLRAAFRTIPEAGVTAHADAAAPVAAMLRSLRRVALAAAGAALIGIGTAAAAVARATLAVHAGTVATVRELGGCDRQIAGPILAGMLRPVAGGAAIGATAAAGVAATIRPPGAAAGPVAAFAVTMIPTALLLTAIVALAAGTIAVRAALRRTG